LIERRQVGHPCGSARPVMRRCCPLTRSTASREPLAISATNNR
jgi:hypothetical protein